MNIVTDDMIRDNEGLIMHTIKKYFPYPQKIERIHGYTLDDLMQFGRIGLYYALQNRDKTKGELFTKYATLYIRGEILKNIRNSYHGVKVRVKIANATREYNKRKYEEDFDINAFINKFKLNEDDFEEVMSLAHVGFVQGDAKVSGCSDDATYFDFAYTEDNYGFLDQEENLYTMMETLSDSQKDVLLLHLEGYPSKEIGKKLNKSVSNVTSTIHNALKRLRSVYGTNESNKRELVG